MSSVEAGLLRAGLWLNLSASLLASLKLLLNDEIVGEMLDLLELEISCIEWSKLSSDGQPLNDVPDHLRLLANASIERIGDEAYREIAQYVSDQSRLFEGALIIIRPLLAIVATSSSEIGKRLAIEILGDIGAARPDVANTEAYRLAEQCRELIMGGMLEYYRALQGKDPMLRDWALWTISRYDRNRERSSRAVEHVMDNDPDERVRHSAHRIHHDSEFEFSWMNAELKKRIARGL